MRSPRPVVFVIATVLSLSSLVSLAQPAPEGTVTGVGVAEIKRVPELMRMEITLTAQGADAREAAARLKELQAAAKPKLTALGAVESSIDLGAVRVQPVNERQQQMQRMARMQQRGNRRATTGPAASPPVIVMATVKAEWPLAQAAPDQVFVAAMELQGKIGAAGLAASPRALTPEEQEILEENGGMNGDEPSPGTPSFLFVSKVSADDRATALGEAFGKAKADATRLAQAAGASLGPIRQLSSNASPDYDESAQYNMGYRRYMYAAMQQQQGRGGGAETLEAIGVQPTEVSLQLTVSAAFALKGP